jgi:hypothetical protein
MSVFLVAYVLLGIELYIHIEVFITAFKEIYLQCAKVFNKTIGLDFGITLS